MFRLRTGFGDGLWAGRCVGKCAALAGAVSTLKCLRLGEAQLVVRPCLAAVETLHQVDLSLRGRGQLVAQCCAAVSVVGGAVGQVGDIADVAIDLFGYAALLLGGAGDLAGHFVDALDGLANAL